MSTTLLGYLKTQLINAGATTKYFNRYFLTVFLTEYHESHRSGVANYEKTKTTDFYTKNSGSYCVFLEVYNEYREMMDRLNGLTT